MVLAKMAGDEVHSLALPSVTSSAAQVITEEPPERLGDPIRGVAVHEDPVEARLRGDELIGVAVVEDAVVDDPSDGGTPI